MNKIIVKIGSLAISSSATKFISTPIIKRDARIYITSSLYAKPPFSFRCFTSNTSSIDKIPSGSDRPKNPDVQDLSREELKARIEKYFAGDAEAISDIFEGILKRKLAGTHAESDDELMQEFKQIPINNEMDKDVDSEYITDGDTSDDDFAIKTPDMGADDFFESD